MGGAHFVKPRTLSSMCGEGIHDPVYRPLDASAVCCVGMIPSEGGGISCTIRPNTPSSDHPLATACGRKVQGGGVPGSSWCVRDTLRRIAGHVGIFGTSGRSAISLSPIRARG